MDAVIVEDAVEKSVAVDDTAPDDTTSDDAIEDDVGPADVVVEDTAEDDGFDEAEESGGLLYGRTSSVLVQTMTFSFFTTTHHNILQEESVDVSDKQHNPDVLTAVSPIGIVQKRYLKGNEQKVAGTSK